MLTKYALVAVIVLCLTVLGFTLLVGDSLCEFTVKERNIEFKAVLAYERVIPAYPVVRSGW
ncbi:Hok/Gef family protein [Escherichia coli]|uniref:Hok/Gef family protein n=1 Tax=Escherichia coli TaxID=562 RepID=UPI001F4AA48C|nr:Hok/Gef family protein [Escherichia coli]